MTLDDFLNHIEAGGALNTPEIYRLMDEMSDEAQHKKNCVRSCRA